MCVAMPIGGVGEVGVVRRRDGLVCVGASAPPTGRQWPTTPDASARAKPAACSCCATSDYTATSLANSVHPPQCIVCCVLMAHLTLSLKGREVSRHPLTGETRIGRDPSSQLLIDNVGVSRHHATIRVDGESRYSILDAGSQNGVFVNGKRVSERQLVDGDVIQIGKFTLEYSSIDGSMPKPLVAEKPQRPAGGRAQQPTFALDAEQLQQVLATSKHEAAIAAASAPHPRGESRAAGARADSADDAPVRAAPDARGPFAMPELALDVRAEARRAESIAPLLWVGLGLTVLCVIAALVIL